MQPHLRRRCGGWCLGGILTYATNRLYEEVAYVAYYFHWPLNEIRDMEHADRERFVKEIAAINRRLNTTNKD